MKPKIVIVDKDNNVIGAKPRDEVDYQKDIYQSAALWITNSTGQVLMAQRKLTKDKDPGKWGPAVAGTIDEGETYGSNIIKEAEEEIGLTGVEFKLGPDQYEHTPRKHFIQWFLCKLDKPVEEFVPQEDEVEQLKWVDQKQLVSDMKNNPEKYVPSLPHIIDLLINHEI